MQVCLHGKTFPEIQYDIDLSDLLNCLCLTVIMQVWTAHKLATFKKTQDTPNSMARIDWTEKIDKKNLMDFVPNVGIDKARLEWNEHWLIKFLNIFTI